MRRILWSVLTLALSLWLTTSSSAQTFNWNTGTDNWNDGLNWTPNGVPNDPAHIAVLGGTGPYEVTMDINVTLDRLDLLGSDANLTVTSRTLTMLGNAGIGVPMGVGNTQVLRLNSATFEGGGQLTNWATVAASGSTSIENLYNEGLFQALGRSTFGNANVSLSGTMFNAGTLDMITEDGAFLSTLNIDSGGQLENIGTFNVSTGAGGGRTINGSILNRGFFNVGQPMTYNTGPFIQEQNRTTVGPTHSMNFGNNSTFQLDGGELQIDGSLLVPNGTFIWNEGDITAQPPKLANTDLQLDFSNLGTGNIRMAGGSSTIDGIWRQGRQLQIYGESTFGNATVNWLGTGDLITLGDVLMSSENGGFAVTARFPAGGRLVNRGNWLIEPGAGGGRTLNGDFQNDLAGTMTFNVGTTLQGGPYENLGTMTATGGSQLTFTNSVDFTMTDGTLDLSDGNLLHPNGTANFVGGSVLGIPQYAASDLTFGAGFNTAFEARLYGSSTVTGDLKNSQTLNLIGQNVYGNSTALLTQPMNNAGTVVMSSENGGFNVIFNDGGNGVTNTGTIRTEVGATGARTIRANLQNDGNIEFQTATVLGPGSYVNNGTWNVTPTGSASFNNSLSFTQQAGTLQIDGSWEHANGDAFFNGGQVNGTPLFSSTDITFDAGFTTPFDAIFRGSGLWTGDLKAGQSLTQRGDGTFGASTINVAGGNVNDGTIELTTESGAFSTRLGTSNQVWTNSGTIRTLPGQGGTRFLRGDLTNTGDIDVQQSMTFEDGPILHQGGTISVAAGQKISFNSSMNFEQSGGDVVIDGSFEQQSGTVRLMGGTMTGTPGLGDVGRPLFSSMTIELGAGFTDPGFDARLRGSSTLTGDLETGQTLTLRGDGSFGNGTLNFGGAVENRGTINLTSEGGGFQARMGTTNVDFTNTGTINIENGAGGFRYLRGNLALGGAVNVNHGTTTLEDGPVQMSGNFNVASGVTTNFNSSMVWEVLDGANVDIQGALEIASGTTRFFGGAISGIPLISSGSLELGPNFDDPVEVNLRGTVTLNGDSEADQFLRMRGDGSFGNGNLVIPAPMTHRGEIELTAEQGAFTSTLTATLGNEVTNEGVIRTIAGSGGGARNLSMQLENDGEVQIQTATTLGRGGANHSNRGVMRMTAPLTLTGTSFTNVNGGRVESNATITNASYTVINDGTWAIGDDVGTNTITGNFTQSSDGRLVVKIGGFTPGTEHDQVVVQGTASLDGRVRIQTVNGFQPQFGDQFVILTAASTVATGFQGISFDGDLPLGYGFELVDTGTQLIAQVAQTINGIAPGERPLEVGDPVPGIAGQVNTFQVAGGTGSGQIFLVYGLNLGTTPTGACSGVDFGIDAAVQVGSGFASTNGNALISANVPAAAAGMTAYFQALDLERCELSEVVDFVFP